MRAELKYITLLVSMHPFNRQLLDEMDLGIDYEDDAHDELDWSNYPAGGEP